MLFPTASSAPSTFSNSIVSTLLQREQSLVAAHCLQQCEVLPLLSLCPLHLLHPHHPHPHPWSLLSSFPWLCRCPLSQGTTPLRCPCLVVASNSVLWLLI